MLLTSSVLVDLLLLLGLLLYLSYKYLSRNHGYWQKRGVYTPKFVPVVGHLLDIVLGRYTFPELFKRHYDKTNEKYFGLYFFDDPIFFVKDPELIKNIMVKDSNFFNDRAVGIPKHDEVQSNLMFFQKSPAWKVLRTKSTPAFTSAKLKFMMPLISECANEMIDYLLENQGVLEARELSVKYATNVIAKCAFGINAGCFRNNKAEFRERAKPIFMNTWKNAIVQAIYFLKPSWLDTFKLEFFDKGSIDYFKEIILETMYNRSDDVKYNDLIDIMKDLRKQKEISEVELDDAKLVAVAIQFFLAGFETTSGTISFTLHELSLNKEVQNKLREEINDVVDKFGKITYESVKEMRYLDCCINEALRKYPGLPFLERRCNRDYQISDTDVVIKQGIPVFISVSGLHLDEKYFPDPHRYDPDRFIDGRANNKLAYLPFGDGPRVCIGERFGRLSVKLAVIDIIRNFELEKCDNTPDPVEFDPKCFLLTSICGLPIRVKQIIKQSN